MPENYTLNETATRDLVAWAKNIQATATDDFSAAQQFLTRCGAHMNGTSAEFGFWAPDVVQQDVSADQVFLEIFTPPAELDLLKAAQTLTFQRDRIPMTLEGDFAWAVVDGLPAGTREQTGIFYWLAYQRNDGSWGTIKDHLAYSVPFGVLAPAELYDMNALQAERGDKDHFQRLITEPDPDGVQRIQPPVNILQIHPGTASEEGTIAGLTRIYQRIAQKINNGDVLDPAEVHYIGYDAIQLMPIEPPIEHEAGPLFWEMGADDLNEDSVTVTLRQHDIINWGYDVMISGSPATNPAVLSSKRPHELLDLIVTLHNFPGKPIMFMLDIVYGHTDNQALPLLWRDYLAGANMYGQNLNYLNPVVRATLIEMQRRKQQFGVDGVRVDGAQDFKWWDEATDTMIHDDDYLRLMNDIVQDVAGVQYRPWMIFEDGRPWPRDDWELSSTYREITKQMPNVWQWGPLTFAHNTPFLFTFWVMKWWRIQEMATVGREWITGCANHDTLRRGTQVPTNARINTYLGDTLPEIIENAYDNPAAKLFDYAMMPGVPMDFINASMRAPWGFIRNTDDRYGVKVVSEEANFSDWRINEDRWSRPEFFTRLKAEGFTKLSDLRYFVHALDHAVQATHYNLTAIADILNTMPGIPMQDFTVERLKKISLAWMEDVHDFCNVSYYAAGQSGEKADFNYAVRRFRVERPWLLGNLGDGEHFDYLKPADGTVIFYGLRRAPDDSQQVLFIANMEGAPRTVQPLQLPIPGLAADGWRVALVSPGLTVLDSQQTLTLHDSQGVVFSRG